MYILSFCRIPYIDFILLFTTQLYQTFSTLPFTNDRVHLVFCSVRTPMDVSFHSVYMFRVERPTFLTALRSTTGLDSIHVLPEECKGLLKVTCNCFILLLSPIALLLSAASCHRNTWHRAYIKFVCPEVDETKRTISG